MLSLHSCTNIIFSKETSFPSVPLCSRQKTHSSTLQPLGQFISCFSKTSIWLTCSDQTWTRWKTREGNLHCKKALKWLFCLECWRMRFRPSDVTRTAMYFTSGWKLRRSKGSTKCSRVWGSKCEVELLKAWKPRKISLRSCPPYVSTLTPNNFLLLWNN